MLNAISAMLDGKMRPRRSTPRLSKKPLIAFDRESCHIDEILTIHINHAKMLTLITSVKLLATFVMGAAIGRSLNVAACAGVTFLIVIATCIAACQSHVPMLDVVIVTFARASCFQLGFLVGCVSANCPFGLRVSILEWMLAPEES